MKQGQWVDPAILDALCRGMADDRVVDNRLRFDSMSIVVSSGRVEIVYRWQGKAMCSRTVPVAGWACGGTLTIESGDIRGSIPFRIAE